MRVVVFSYYFGNVRFKLPASSWALQWFSVIFPVTIWSAISCTILYLLFCCWSRLFVVATFCMLILNTTTNFSTISITFLSNNHTDFWLPFFSFFFPLNHGLKIDIIISFVSNPSNAGWMFLLCAVMIIFCKRIIQKWTPSVFRLVMTFSLVTILGLQLQLLELAGLIMVNSSLIRTQISHH